MTVRLPFPVIRTIVLTVPISAQEPLLAALISRIGRTSDPELISTGIADGTVRS